MLVLAIAGVAGCSSSSSQSAVDAPPSSQVDGPPTGGTPDAAVPTIDAAPIDGPQLTDPVTSSSIFETSGPIAVAVDPAGTPVIAGGLDLTTNFGGTTLAPDHTQTSGSKDIFAGKLSGGTATWAKKYGDPVDQYASTVAVNADGLVLLAGPFSGTMTYRSDMPPLMTTQDTGVAFAMAVDGASGDAAWASLVKLGVDLGGTILAVAPDGAGGGFVLAGYATDAASFGTFTGQPGGGEDIFVAKVRGGTTFDLAWARQIGGAGDSGATAVAVDSAGNVFLAGYYKGTLDFGNGALPEPSGNRALFVAKLAAADGAVMAAVGIGTTGAGNHQANSIAVDSNGNVILGGQIRGADVAFDPDPQFTLSPRFVDGFVAKLEPDLGHAKWTRRIGDSDAAALLTQRVLGVALDGSGDVVAVGSFQGTVDFGLALPIAVAGASTGRDAFAVKLAGASGLPVWVRTTNGAGDEAATGVAVAGNGTVWVTGTFLGDTTPPIANWGTTLATEMIFPLDTRTTHTYLVGLKP